MSSHPLEMAGCAICRSTMQVIAHGTIRVVPKCWSYVTEVYRVIPQLLPYESFNINQTLGNAITQERWTVAHQWAAFWMREYKVRVEQGIADKVE